MLNRRPRILLLCDRPGCLKRAGWYRDWAVQAGVTMPDVQRCQDHAPQWPSFKRSTRLAVRQIGGHAVTPEELLAYTSPPADVVDALPINFDEAILREPVIYGELFPVHRTIPAFQEMSLVSVPSNADAVMPDTFDAAIRRASLNIASGVLLPEELLDDAGTRALEEAFEAEVTRKILAAIDRSIMGDESSPESPSGG